jgi:hypothetical protein
VTLARSGILAATIAFAFVLLLAAAAAGVCSVLTGGLLGASTNQGIDHGRRGASIVTCRIGGGIHGNGLDLNAAQASNAAVINQVAAGLGITPRPRAVTIALATAIQESDLRNLDYGTYDSLGLFQQRPSQGWGSRAQVINPAYAAWQFYTHLARVPRWWQIPIWAAAQAVQRSAYPTAYQAHAAEAAALQQFLATAPAACGTSQTSN